SACEQDTLSPQPDPALVVSPGGPPKATQRCSGLVHLSGDSVPWTFRSVAATHDPRRPERHENGLDWHSYETRTPWMTHRAAKTAGLEDALRITLLTKGRRCAR